MQEKTLVVCRAGRAGGSYALFFTNNRMVAAQIGTLAGALASFGIGGPVGLVLKSLSDDRRFRQLTTEIKEKGVDFDQLVSADPKNASISYRDVEFATLYKKLGPCPLVIKKRDAKITFRLQGGKSYEAVREVLRQALGDKFKAKGLFWSCLTKPI